MVLTFSTVGINVFLLLINSNDAMNPTTNQQHMSGDDMRGLGNTGLKQGHSVHVEGTKPISDVKDNQVRRKKALIEACTDLEFEERPTRDQNLTLEELTSLKHTYVFDKHRILYCYLPKVSCTSWKHLFLVSYGAFSPVRKRGEVRRSVHTEFDKVFKKIGQLPEDEANRKIKDYTQFLFVRNPFSRVLSAYREKIEFKNPEDPVDGYYSQFITRWLKKTNLGYLNQRNKTTPYSFQEFVRYFMARRVEDEHWNDQYELCHPCLVEYDFIGKIETLHEDVHRFLGSVANGSSLVFPAADPQKHTWNSSSDQNMARYYWTISDDDFISLIECLYTDLRLFGYAIPIAIRRPRLRLSRKYALLVDVG